MTNRMQQIRTPLVLLLMKHDQSLGSAETSCPTVGGAAAWPDHRGRGQLQCWSAAAGVSGESSAQEEQDTGAR